MVSAVGVFRKNLRTGRPILTGPKKSSGSLNDMPHLKHRPLRAVSSSSSFHTGSPRKGSFAYIGKPPGAKPHRNTGDTLLAFHLPLPRRFSGFKETTHPHTANNCMNNLLGSQLVGPASNSNRNIPCGSLTPPEQKVTFYVARTAG